MRRSPLAQIIQLIQGSCSLLAVLGSALALRADEAAGRLGALVEKRAPSIVSVRAVIKTEVSAFGQSDNQESREELQGAVVDESGLVMISNALFSPQFPGMPAGQMELKVTPVEIRVVVGNEEKEYDAFLAARDSKLNLAFLQVKDLGERKLAAVSFEGEGKAAVGDEVVAVGRLEKGFDYAPYFSTARVSGEIRKPRPALVHTGTIGTLGLPVFTASGEVVGVLTELESGLKAEESAGPGILQALSFMRGGGAGAPSFIVPASAVKGVVAQAKKRAGELGEGGEAGEKAKE
jgi:S1-C subfamily serine protease